MMHIRTLKRLWFNFIFAHPGFHPDGYSDDDSTLTPEEHALIREVLRHYAVGFIEDKILYCYPIVKWAVRHPGRPLPFGIGA